MIYIREIKYIDIRYVRNTLVVVSVDIPNRLKRNTPVYSLIPSPFMLIGIIVIIVSMAFMSIILRIGTCCPKAKNKKYITKALVIQFIKLNRELYSILGL
jgi:hypothetical protein